MTLLAVTCEGNLSWGECEDYRMLYGVQSVMWSAAVGKVQCFYSVLDLFQYNFSILASFCCEQSLCQEVTVNTNSAGVMAVQCRPVSASVGPCFIGEI